VVVPRVVLVLTGSHDPTADAVISEITRRGIRAARHDLGDFPARAWLSAIHNSKGWSGRIIGPDTTTNLDEVVAVYYRRPSRFTFPPGMSDANLAYAEAKARLGMGGVLADHGQHKITYTTLVDPHSIDHTAFAATTHLLQVWVPKAREVRATVVGKQVLAVAIDADSARARVDWRADYDALRYGPITVPAEVTVGMLAYLRAFELHYGGFDFVITPHEEWIMLECNPSAQWLWLHHTAGLPIPTALAELLIGTHP
jgi:hypothetical protein